MVMTRPGSPGKDEKSGSLRAAWPWPGGRLPAGKDAGELLPQSGRGAGRGRLLLSISFKVHTIAVGSQPQELETRRPMESQGGPISELSRCPVLGRLEGEGD